MYLNPENMKRVYSQNSRNSSWYCP